MLTQSPDAALAPDTTDAVPDPVSGSAFRARRLATFLELADRVLARQGTCRILDLGGELAYWKALRDHWRGRNLEITLVNTTVSEATREGPFIVRPGDARALPDLVDDSYDIVHSNSVIEHVGTWMDMRAMADEVRRLAPAYFLQTPNYWFPYEPHLRVPFIHWIPRPWRRRIVMARACGFYPKAADVAEAYKILADASLLDAAGMEALFPDATILRERVGPFTKSLMAVRAARGAR